MIDERDYIGEGERRGLGAASGARPLQRETYHFLHEKKDRNPHLYVSSVTHATIRAAAPAGFDRQRQPHRFAWKSARIAGEYQIVYISDGTGEFETSQTGRCSVDAGAALLILPGVWHRYRPGLSTGWTESSVRFGGIYVDYLRSTQIIRASHPILHLTSGNPAMATFHRMLELARSPSKGQAQSLTHHLFELLEGIREAGEAAAGAETANKRDLLTRAPVDRHGEFEHPGLAAF